MELLGQRAKRLRKKHERIDGNGELAALGAHNVAFNADPVAHVEVFHFLESLFTKEVDAAEQLDIALALAQDHEHDLALLADGHNTTGNLDAVVKRDAVFKRCVLLFDLIDVHVVIETHAVRLLARSVQRLALGLAHLDGVVLDKGFCLYLVVVLRHVLPYLLMKKAQLSRAFAWRSKRRPCGTSARS